MVLTAALEYRHSSPSELCGLLRGRLALRAVLKRGQNHKVLKLGAATFPRV
jgi:hypothetical protein